MTLNSRLWTKCTYEDLSYLSHSLSDLGVLKNILVKGVNLKPNKRYKFQVYMF